MFLAQQSICRQVHTNTISPAKDLAGCGLSRRYVHSTAAISASSTAEIVPLATRNAWRHLAVTALILSIVPVIGTCNNETRRSALAR
jgi:hypothetical protein